MKAANRRNPVTTRRAALPRGLRALVAVVACSSCVALFGSTVPGNTRKFDPVKAVPEMRAVLDADYQLERLTAKGVRPNGTIDLEDERVEGRALYGFVRAVPEPPDPPPVGAGGSLDGRWSQSASVVVERRGLHLIRSSPEAAYRKSRGMQIDQGEPEPGVGAVGDRGPLCSFAALFRVARAEGAPTRDIVASIHYSAGKEDGGGSYHFIIEGTPFNYMFNTDCRRVKGPECLRLALETVGAAEACMP